jgi:hypothetical protein
MDRVCSTNGEKRNEYMSLVGKQDLRRPLGRSRRRWCILKWMLDRMGGVGTGLISLRIGTG